MIPEPSVASPTTVAPEVPDDDKDAEAATPTWFAAVIDETPEERPPECPPECPPETNVAAAPETALAATDAEDPEDEDAFFWSVAYDVRPLCPVDAFNSSVYDIPVLLAMQLVGHLQLKFPDMDPARLCSLLKAVHLDVDLAHAVLKATLERENTGTAQVCRHYLAGECRRADCMVRANHPAIRLRGLTCCAATVSARYTGHYLPLLAARHVSPRRELSLCTRFY